MSDESDDIMDALTSITKIGAEWGLTNRALGDLLTNAGYRCDGKPTTKAFDEGLAVVTFVGEYTKYFWSREIVGQFLEKSGRKKGRPWDRDGKQLFLVVPLVF